MNNLKFIIEYGLVEDPTFEGIKECNSMTEVNTFLSTMEGLLEYHHVYDENGNEICIK